MLGVTDNPSMHNKPPTSTNTRHTWLWSDGFRAAMTALAVVVSLLCSFTVVARADTLPAAYGIDISHYNTITDPAAIAAGGITFAYVKTTEGLTYTDPTLTLHVAQLRDVGIRVGGYHFADGPDCGSQAHHFRQVLDGQGLLGTGALIPMLDLEAPALAAVADACVRAFYDALGSPLLAYGNLTWWTTYLHPATWGTRQILGWIARYNGDPGQPGLSSPILAIHQHTDRGTVPGIAGYVDRDALMPGRSLAELVLGGPTVTAPVPTPAPTPVPTPMPTRVVHIVVRGDTVSAIARRWGVTVAAIAAANGLGNPNLIFPGERLYRPTGPTPPPVVVSRPRSAPRSVVVHSGETLSGIAARLHYPGGWPALARRNRLADPNRVRPGERLTV